MTNWNLERLRNAVTVCYNHATTNTSIKKNEIRIQTPEELDTNVPLSSHR